MASTTRHLRRLNKPIRDVRQAVEKIRLHDLSQETLRHMQRDLQREQLALENEANEVQQSLEINLSEGHAIVLGDHKKLVRQIAREHDEIGEKLAEVHDALQHRMLDDRLIRVLGGKWRVQALEYIVMSLVFFVLGVLVFDLASPNLSAETKRIITFTETACCLVFLAEFFFRHHYADSKLWFWRRHWIDFVTSVPLPYMQALRVGGVALFVPAFRVLQVLRIVLFFWRAMDKLAKALDVKMMKRSVLLVMVLVVLGANFVHFAPGESEGVQSLWRGAWWSFTSVVSSGFGDTHNATTTTMRALAVVLVIAGMVVVGIFTARLASLLMRDESERLEVMKKSVDERLDAIEKRIGSLDDSVKRMDRGGSYAATGRLLRPPDDDT